MGGGPEKIEKVHQSGKLTARERLERLLDPGSFVEFGRLYGHLDNTPGDGLVAGHGNIDGRPVYVEFAKPIRVAGLAAQFFRACGIQPAVAGTFQPRHCVGKQMLVRFDRDADGHWHPVRFEPVVKEPVDDATE